MAEEIKEEIKEEVKEECGCNCNCNEELCCESNNDEEPKKVVVYKALYGDYHTWVRPYDMFNSEVDHDKYPDVKQKYRFEEFTEDMVSNL